jgi:hypothetical protein
MPAMPVMPLMPVMPVGCQCVSAPVVIATRQTITAAMVKKLFVMEIIPYLAPRIRALDQARTSGQDVFLWSGLRAVRQASHNLSFSRREPRGLFCLARHVPRFAAAPQVRLGPYHAGKSAAAPLSRASATSGSSVLSCKLSSFATAAKTDLAI